MNVPNGPRKASYIPDPAYHLSAGEKSKVMEIFDVNALERLLSMLPAADRPGILAHFQYPDGEMAPPPPKLVHLDDPDLQAVVEEVWVPFWDTVPLSAMYEESGIPGRQLALSRLQAGQ